MRRAARKDETQGAIVDGLRRMGYRVKILNDTPDLIVQNPNNLKVRLMEVDGVTKNRRRSGAQLDFIHEWSIPRVKNIMEALTVMAETASPVIDMGNPGITPFLKYPGAL